MHKKHLLKSCTLILCLEGFSYIWNKVTCNLQNLLRFFALLQCFTGIEARLWYFTRFAQIAWSSLVLFISHGIFHCRKCHALWFFSLCYIKVRSSKKSVLKHLSITPHYISFQSIDENFRSASQIQFLKGSYSYHQIHKFTDILHT